MAYLFSDGFDWMSAVGDVTLRWDNGTIASLVAAANTPFGVGQALSFGANNFLTKTFASNEATIFAHLRRKQIGGTSGTVGASVQFFDGSSAQCTVRLNEDGSISAHSGGVNGTALGTTAPGVAAVNAWDGWQIKVVFHNTAGSVEVRKNGSVSPVLSLTNVNTRLGSTNNYANRVTLGAGTNTHQIDDVFFNSGSGAAPNDWPGDSRALPQAPVANAAVQFTPTPASTSFQATNSATGSNLPGANALFLTKTVAAMGGLLSSVMINNMTTPTGKVNAAIYAADGISGGPGTLLAAGTEIAVPAAASLTINFASPAAVVRNTTYWLGVMSNAALNVQGNVTAGAGAGHTVPVTYSAGFPATITGAPNETRAHNHAWTVTSIPNYSSVGDPLGQDGDTSYVSSSIVGQEDLYMLAPLPVTPQTILGVIPYVVAKKSDAGARTAAVQAKSGATEVSAATNAAIGASYSFLGGFLAADPNTGAPWTKAAVEALQVGPKVAA